MANSRMSNEDSQSELVRRTISEEILTGQLRPGDFLSETRLAERFNMSRTPVREAIRVLAGYRLVQLRPGQRPIVRGQSFAEILDQFEAMAELEASCARLAARRRAESDLREMERAQDQCKKLAALEDVDKYYEANVRFHDAIYSAAGNNYLEMEALRLRDRLRFLRISQGRLPGRLNASSKEHDVVLNAIKKGQESIAAEAMRKHVVLQGEGLRTILRDTELSVVVTLPE